MTALKKHKSKNNYDIYGDVAKIKAALVDVTEDVKGKAAEMLFDSYQNMKDETAEAKENISSFVADKPFKSVGAALLVGAAIGYFLRK